MHSSALEARSASLKSPRTSYCEQMRRRMFSASPLVNAYILRAVRRGIWVVWQWWIKDLKLIDLGEELEESDNSGRLFYLFQSGKKGASDGMLWYFPKGLLKEDINQNVQGEKRSRSLPVTVLVKLGQCVSEFKRHTSQHIYVEVCWPCRYKDIDIDDK